MTKKDFKLIAGILSEVRKDISNMGNLTIQTKAILDAVTYNFARNLNKTSPRFNSDKFLKACGL